MRWMALTATTFAPTAPVRHSSTIRVLAFVALVQIFSSLVAALCGSKQSSAKGLTVEDALLDDGGKAERLNLHMLEQERVDARKRLQS